MTRASGEGWKQMEVEPCKKDLGGWLREHVQRQVQLLYNTSSNLEQL